jgi:hypothetical protein
MEEIFIHVTTRDDCDAFIEEIKLNLTQLEGKELRIEMFFIKYADTQLKCSKRIEELKMELAHIHSYLDIIRNDATLEGLQLKKLTIELKLIHLERELTRQTKASLAQKHLDLLLLKHKIQFLNKVLTLAQKRKAEL